MRMCQLMIAILATFFALHLMAGEADKNSNGSQTTYDGYGGASKNGTGPGVMVQDSETPLANADAANAVDGRDQKKLKKQAAQKRRANEKQQEQKQTKDKK